MQIKTGFEDMRVGKAGLSFIDFLIRFPLYALTDYVGVCIIMFYLMLLK